MSAGSPSGTFEPELEEAPASIGYYVGATCFVFFSAFICYYWVAFVLTNTLYVHEYSTLNTFQSGRYHWINWWAVWILSLNVLLPLTFCFALTYANLPFWRSVHTLCTILCMIGTLYALLVLSIGWAFYCNNAGTANQTACNAYTWCGKYFDSIHCPNGQRFPDPFDVSDQRLGRNAEMTQHWIYCWVYLLMAVFHLWMNSTYKERGIFQ